MTTIKLKEITSLKWEKEEDALMNLGESIRAALMAASGLKFQGNATHMVNPEGGKYSDKIPQINEVLNSCSFI